LGARLLLDAVRGSRRHSAGDQPRAGEGVVGMTLAVVLMASWFETRLTPLLTMRVWNRRVAKGALAPCPPSHAPTQERWARGACHRARVRATRWLCPPYASLPPPEERR